MVGRLSLGAEVNEAIFKQRTKNLAIEIMHLVDGLPRGRSSEILGRQLLRSATSVGANYRAACRGRSAAEMIAKLGVVVEEGDESLYWLELLIESNLVDSEIAKRLWQETNEIVSMTVSSIRTMKANQTQSKI